MYKLILVFVSIFGYISVHAQDQPDRNIRITVVNEKKMALPGSTVYLLNADSVVIHSGVANASGTIEFLDLSAGKYQLPVPARPATSNGYSS